MGYSEDFIPDGMNAFERNVKRIGDCIIAGILLIIFSPLFLPRLVRRKILSFLFVKNFMQNFFILNSALKLRLPP